MFCTHTVNGSDDAERTKTPPLPYHPPIVSVYGDVRILTQGGNLTTSSDEFSELSG
jgi:hypothetical protein